MYNSSQPPNGLQVSRTFSDILSHWPKCIQEGMKGHKLPGLWREIEEKVACFGRKWKKSYHIQSRRLFVQSWNSGCCFTDWSKFGSRPGVIRVCHCRFHQTIYINNIYQLIMTVCDLCWKRHLNIRGGNQVFSVIVL